jgi:hypothetical protein
MAFSVSSDSNIPLFANYLDVGIGIRNLPPDIDFSGNSMSRLYDSDGRSFSFGHPINLENPLSKRFSESVPVF